MSPSKPALRLTAWIARLLPPQVKQAIYRSPALAGALRSILNRAAPREMSEIEVAAGGLTGMTLSLDLQREKDYWLGTYETDLQQAIRDWIKPGMIAYDVGASIGYIALLLALAVGESGHVFAFEALPANVERLERNLYLNRMTSRVTAIPSAVIDRTGSARFLVGPSNATGKAQGSSGRLENQSSQAFEVAGLCLDDFVFRQGKPPPDFVKMDIEGGEVLALPGMMRVIQEIAPLLFLELHGPESSRQAWSILVSQGYKIYRMHPGYPEVKSVLELDWKAYLLGVPSRPA
jgi:FkbM family methyltransferase